MELGSGEWGSRNQGLDVTKMGAVLACFLTFLRFWHVFERFCLFLRVLLPKMAKLGRWSPVLGCRGVGLATNAVGTLAGGAPTLRQGRKKLVSPRSASVCMCFGLFLSLFACFCLCFAVFRCFFVKLRMGGRTKCVERCCGR